MIRRIATLIFLLLPCLAIAAEQTSNVPVTETGVYAPFHRLINDKDTLDADTLRKIDYSILRVALYQIEDRRSIQVQKSTHAMLESRITEKLVESGRFQVVSCVECKTTRVTLVNQKLKVSQPIESNDQLKELGEKLKVDAFLLWQTIATEDSESISFQLVKAEDNTVIWAKQYTDNAIADLVPVHYDVYVGLIAQNMSRTDTVTGDVVRAESLTSMGVRRREKASFNPALEYALGVEFVNSIFAPSEFDIYGIMIEGRVLYDTQRNANLGPAKLYAGVGEFFLEGSQSIFVRGGLEYALGENGFVDIGFMYLRDTDVDWGSDGDYESSSTIGGMSGELVIGLQL